MTSPGNDENNWLNRTGGLPDPVQDRQFYDGVALRRLVAFFIDVVLIWGSALLIGLLTLGIAFLFIGFLIAIIDFFYRVITLTGRSATPGMRLAGIELRDDEGARFGVGEALLHTLLFYLSVTFFLVHLISMFMMAGTALGRGLHDLPLGSTMINSPA